MSRPDPGEVFASDEHRRVLGNLARPRSVASLNAELFKDPHVTLSESEIYDHLSDLEAEGYVKKLGEFDDPAEVVSAAGDDPDVRSLHPSVGKIFKERYGSPLRSHEVQGEHWAMTERGFDALTGPSDEEEEG